ncbi:hypothetical protein [Butyrivibrio sp. XPD2002]|uniref:hypothetical protein n=1 Tax=Butyrivibrio sp. XPD2002 TaxID=1280665 RepID=UPI000420323B|nr:hypothetical protein [Butyrivibrio sp. XPD2002]MCR5343400.1 hypothetical protein [Butyrivibrio sp.]
MGFFDIFKKKDTYRQERHQQNELENWNDIVYTRKNIDIDDPAQRREYVENCLQQMAEASRDMDSLQFEYRVVTSHLRDMEEIDALPPENREEVNDCAKRIIDSEEQQKNFNKRKSRMTDQEFEKMERLANDAKKGAKTLLDAEEHQKKVKNDLRRLDEERKAYELRRAEIEISLDNMQKLMIVIAAALGFITVVLTIISLALKLNVIYGYMVAIVIAALSFLLINQKIHEQRREKKVVLNSMARLIQLQNTVKIRYVNNKNLIDYECMKYGISNSRELSSLYNKYLLEKTERERYANATKQLDANQKALVFTLRKYRIKDPDIWVHQAIALINHNEEVEIRHELVGQRQALRKQMDYKRDVVAGNAKTEIEELVKQYPVYRQEILDMVDRFEQRYPGA